MTIRQILDKHKPPVRVRYTGEANPQKIKSFYVLPGESTAFPGWICIVDDLHSPTFHGRAPLDKDEYEFFNPIQVAQEAFDKLSEWVLRGDAAFYFVNHDLGHPECGRGIFLCYDRKDVDVARVGETQAPDTKVGLGWRYILERIFKDESDLVNIEVV